MPTEFERHRRRHHARKRRVKWLLKKLPRKTNLTRYPVIKWFADAARQRPYLWSFKLEHVRPAFYAGAVIGVIPVPMQTLFAFFAMLAFRGNLPIAVALQFTSNPFTFLPLYWATYTTGHLMVGWLLPNVSNYGFTEAFGQVTEGNFTGAWDVMLAFVLGGVVVGLALGFLLELLWRFGAWEARQFKARFAQLHAHHTRMAHSERAGHAGHGAHGAEPVEPARDVQ
jgi:hypothetical protein